MDMKWCNPMSSAAGKSAEVCHNVLAHMSLLLGGAEEVCGCVYVQPGICHHHCAGMQAKYVTRSD